MALQDMFPTSQPVAQPTAPPSGVNLSDMWNFGLGAYDYYKGRDTASDVSKNLSQGYTGAQGQLAEWMGPYAQRGDAAAGTYQGLADNYPGFQLNQGQFDPSQLRDMSYLANTPGYQWRVDQGTNAIESAAAARGHNLSTNVLKDLNKYVQGEASQEYQNEYGRLADQYRINRDTNVANYTANKGDYQTRMQNYLPLMEQGYGAAGNIGRGMAELEVARGGAAATREQNQGSLQNQFLTGLSSGAPGAGAGAPGGGGGPGFATQLGIDNFSLGDVGDAFGNMRDWFNDPNTSFEGTAGDFWAGIRDFELGDMEALISDFF